MIVTLLTLSATFS